MARVMAIFFERDREQDKIDYVCNGFASRALQCWLLSVVAD